jgi:hypothetical protein
MKKKYAIAVIIAVLLSGGFMFYRHHKHSDDGVAYRQKMNSQLTEMAKKSPRAGLSHVGEALMAYYKANNGYPSKLMELYPDYIDNKSLLEEVDWYYQPKGGDFYLSKTIVVGGKRMVASIDNSLRPKADKGIMVASPTPPPAKAGTETLRPESRKALISDETRLAMARQNFLNALQEGRFSVTSVSPPERDEEKLFHKMMPEVLSADDQDGSSGLSRDLGQKYLVWKGAGGELGFSNTQYPDTERLSVFVFGRWYHLKLPPELALGPEPAGSKREKGPRRIETMVAGLDRGLLVWKDDLGIMGFGNVQYPDHDLRSVFSSDEWVPVEKRPVSAETGSPVQEKAKDSTAQVAARFAKNHLVWKGEDGTIGFGNLQYPQKNLDAVFEFNQWVRLEKPSAPPGKKAGQQPEKAHAKPLEAMAAQFARSPEGYLVWKDKGGTIGFGNLQYPEKNIDAVLQNDQWVQVKKQAPLSVQNINHGKDKERSKEKAAARNLDSILSSRYLVWKTEYGTLGFGNLQYPKPGQMSHVRIEGGWEPVTN